MWKTRLIWLLIVLAALSLYLFENNGGTRVILAAVVLLPVCSGAVLFLPPAHLSARLEVSPARRRGEAVPCRLILQNGAKLPLLSVRCEVQVRNLFTGEQGALGFSTALGAGQEAGTAFSVTPLHCGRLTVSVSGLWSVDTFGLFARKLPCDVVGTAMVGPETYPVELSLADTADFLIDSQRYSTQRPGYDPSETFRIREYVPGDPIRQIHWKLTEKADTVLVRDFGLPIVSDMLLLLETTSVADAAIDLERMDAALDLFASVSRALILQDVPHTAGWQDSVSGDYQSVDIHSAEDLADLLDRILSAPLGRGDSTVCGCYGKNHLQCAYAHIAVFSSYAQPDLAPLCHGNRVTVLLPWEGSGDLGLEEHHVPVQHTQLTEGALSLEL